MQREGSIDVRVFECTVVDHQLVSRVSFFAGLKAKDERAVDLIAPAMELLRRGQQNRHVTVVAARVHHALIARAVGCVVEFVDRQCVHVGSQERHRTGSSASERREDAGLADAGADFVVTESAKLSLDERGGLVLLERKLGVRVKVPPVANDLIYGHGLYSNSTSVTPTTGTQRNWAGVN